MAECKCDFCTGAKRWADNWCPCCGEVKLEPPKWWENLDLCDECEERELTTYCLDYPSPCIGEEQEDDE